MTDTVTPEKSTSMGSRLGLGAVAGIVAGIVFIVLNMWFASSTGKPTLAPFKTIATIIQGPPPMTASVPIGIVVHIVLMLVFGLLFAAILQFLPKAPGIVAVAGIVYGAAIYFVDFQVFSRFIPHFGAFLVATNQPFEFTVHVVFGALLALFLMPVARRRHAKATA